MGPVMTPSERHGNIKFYCPDIVLDILDLYDKVNLARSWQECEERKELCVKHIAGICNIAILIKLSILLQLAASTIAVETDQSNINMSLKGVNPEIFWLPVLTLSLRR